MILAHLRGGVVGIYAQKKLNELDEENESQNWEDFIQEIKNTFSDKMKAADTEWKIKTFKQEKRNTADFIIEFEALATKADTDELHAIFLLKKNVWQDIIKMILGYPSMAMPESLKKMRLWHLLHEALTETTSVQPIILSYPQPNSMLYPWGINCNNHPAMHSIPSNML